MAKHSRAEHYATMLSDVHDDIKDDCYKCFTDRHGIHYVQFADGSVIDSDGSSMTKENWEQMFDTDDAVTPCESTPSRDEQVTALLNQEIVG